MYLVPNVSITVSIILSEKRTIDCTVLNTTRQSYSVKLYNSLKYIKNTHTYLVYSMWLYMCVYGCMCVYTYIYMYIYIYRHTHVLIAYVSGSPDIVYLSQRHHMASAPTASPFRPHIGHMECNFTSCFCSTCYSLHSFRT